MGFFSGFAHRSSKKNIQKNIDWYRSRSPDHRAGFIFYAWMVRGANLADFTNKSELCIPIYYYLKGAEVKLLEMIEVYENAKNAALVNACYHHLYTTFAVSYPDEGYGGLVREMWSTLFENYTDLSEMVSEVSPLLDQPAFQPIIKNNDVTFDELIDDPKIIMPHFLVPGNPLSAKLLEEEKMGKLILNE